MSAGFKDLYLSPYDNKAGLFLFTGLVLLFNNVMCNTEFYCVDLGKTL